MNVPHYCRHLLPLLGCTIVLGGVVRAGDTFENRVYIAEKASGPITLDGKLDEAAWRAAPAAAGFTFWDRPEKVSPQTFFRVTFDDRNLYFGIRCDEPRMKDVHPVAQARDAHAVFSGETIEIFIDPKHSHSDYYQLAVNAAGSVYDSRGQDTAWNCGMRAVAHMGKEAWFLEVAVPWKDLGVRPSPGRIIGFNICRDRQVGGKQWSNWSQTQGGFHDPIRFAHLVLGQKGLQLKGLTRELRKGDRAGPIVLFTREGFGKTTYLALARASIRQLDGRLAELEKEVKQEQSPAVRAALRTVLAGIRQKAAAFRKLVRTRDRLDAKTWTDLDQQITRWIQGLDQAVWEARLKALVSEI
ncbi:MAG: hypothetical protein GXP31_13010 [Kiritimatiellaeota bacterium]|nr:hypothetical protein [Kiritimatiellota bacterium]